MKNFSFETALERLGRVLAAQYHIGFVFEGNEAKTDGKTVFLPNFKDIDEELYRDLNGFLDHEVAHCKFTDFGVLKKIKTQYHMELLNATEDVRIEREMVKEFPGTIFNLSPLNDKLRGKIEARRAEIPWPLRVIHGIRDIMEGREPVVEEDIEKYIDVVKESAKELNNCKNTEEIYEKTGEIIKKIIEEEEEQKKQKSKGGDESDEDGDMEEGETSGDGEGKSSPSKSPKLSDFTEAKVGDSKVEKLDTVESMIEASIKENVKREEDDTIRRPRYNVEFKNMPYFPVTTKFDRVTDHSGKGNPNEYAKLKNEVRAIVSPIRREFEKVLKVKENARWHFEKDSGSINPRSLSRMIFDKNYEKVFKRFTKTDTGNVAVEILIDMSGSMNGKITIAKMATIAMGEALKALNIPFEITGFSSEHSRGVVEFASKLGSTHRFVRTDQALDLRIFKGWDCNSMNGITNICSLSENPDGECVLWAAKRLAARTEKRKILMVLSDGMPNAGSTDHGVLCGHLREVITKAKKGGIEVVGVGICTDYVKEFYPDYVSINALEDLPRSALKKLNQIILRGIR